MLQSEPGGYWKVDNSTQPAVNNEDVMKISVAQIRPAKGDIDSNINTHKRLIDLAVSGKADAIFFPELSVTGYEPELAEKLAIDPDDKNFDEFQTISERNKIAIGIGMPTRTSSGIQISMIVFQPGSPRQTYSKQQLHADELPYFVNGDKQIILEAGNKKIAPAICYESLQTNHADQANKLGAEIYAASVAKSQNGVDKAMIHYPLIARQYAMPVLMSNCVGYCDNFKSVGKSAAWTKNGDLAGQLDDRHEGILIFDTETGEVTKHTLN